MKNLSVFNLKIRFYATIHPQGQVSRSRIVRPQQANMGFMICMLKNYMLTKKQCFSMGLGSWRVGNDAGDMQESTCPNTVTNFIRGAELWNLLLSLFVFSNVHVPNKLQLPLKTTWICVRSRGGLGDVFRVFGRRFGEGLGHIFGTSLGNVRGYLGTC